MPHKKTKQQRTQQQQNPLGRTPKTFQWEYVTMATGMEKKELFLQSLHRKTQLDLVMGLNEGKAAKDEWVHGIRHR